MASIPDPHPDSPPAGPSDAPEQVSPINELDRGNEEAIDDPASPKGGAGGPP